MVYALDASALTAYFEKEPGYEKVQTLLMEGAARERPLLLSTVNWGEVLYITSRDHGNEWVQRIVEIMDEFPVKILSVDRETAFQAASYKALHRIPYADCFAAAAAKIHNAVLVTGDKDFKPLEREIKIHWLR